MESHRTSSVYTDSTAPDLSSIPRAASNASSIPSSSSRRHQSISVIPSYMNYLNGAPAKRKAVPTRPTPAAPPVDTSAQAAEPESQGALILVLAAEPPTSTLAHVSTLLQKKRLSGIAVIGHNKYEAALKQLKMDLYALIGRLQFEMGIYTYTTSKWDEDDIAGAVRDAMHHHAAITAVLCAPVYGEGGRTNTELLSLDQADLESAWRTSFGFIHAVAKHTIPKLEGSSSSHALFLGLDAPAKTAVELANKAACDSLFSQLTHGYASRHILVGYAERFLIPDSPPVTTEDILDGKDIVLESHPSESENFGLGESPTKLWNMWALQDEFPEVN